MVGNPVEQAIERDRAEQRAAREAGPVARIARKYDASSDGEPGRRLLGFLLSLNYDELSIVTCDPWKRACGGVPRNSFVMIKLSDTAVGKEDQAFLDRVILARVTDSVPTPVERDIQGAMFQLHKVQAIPDPVTAKELQWSALKASILGTYYDADDGTGKHVAAFGNDVDTFFAPHAYAVFVPTAEDLDTLINSFVSNSDSFEIGRLRYTETPRPGASEDENVPVKVDPRDFVGHEYGNRTALFGKTRMGKSNIIKVIADTILSSDLGVGQVIFDPSGEYTYINAQDGTSLYAMHPDKCVRYSLVPKKLPPEEEERDFEVPKSLKINFYESVSVGHALIRGLWDSEWSDKPGYVQPILNWDPRDLREQPNRSDYSAFKHFWRTMAMWFAVLKLAGYESEPDKRIPVDFQKNVKKELVKKLGDAVTDDAGEFAQTQLIKALPAIYKEVASLWKEHRAKKYWFENSSDGSPYFNDVERALLDILEDEGSKRGTRYLIPFRKYHDVAGSNTFEAISEHARSGKTVLIDFARADEGVRRNLSERICGRILSDMEKAFGEGKLKDDDFVVLYFEEAHQLFPQADRDLNNVYNRLAKEGAKFHVSMVYATQSMTTLSPDLLKNTENFFIAHLDDDREVKEVTRRYAFRDVGDDVQRTMSKGFVRMITQSHRFALPVQIRKFEPREAEKPGSSRSDGANGQRRLP